MQNTNPDCVYIVARDSDQANLRKVLLAHYCQQMNFATRGEKTH